MSSLQSQYDVIIAGGGPAGASAAIHLAANKFRVLVVEQKRFPRAKLCGEFISPECLLHFDKLGVRNEMLATKPSQINKTVFYSRYGSKIEVPSGWFGGAMALGLSRSAMDDALLKRAKSLGVDVLEQATVSNLLREGKTVCGVRVKRNVDEQDLFAPIVVDATGRAGVLVRKAEPGSSQRHKKHKLVAFKAHLTGARGDPEACEIYSYPGGYGGLSAVEKGFSNLCFIIEARHVIDAHSDPGKVIEQHVMSNLRAAHTLKEATIASEWLSVSLESFGRRKPGAAPGLLAIGDSAAFIDPFTGSGMLMALESGQLVAEIIVRYGDKLTVLAAKNSLGEEYARAYRKRFDARLRLCSLLRRVALKPTWAQMTISLCGSSDRFRNWLVRSTRSSVKQNTATVPQPKSV